MSAAQEQIGRAVAGLDAWLDTMRGPGGYGGPVAHWWQQSLIYAGPGLDWRYEGIICGYVKLWRATANHFWLAKARRAGDDLLAGQDAAGHFGASAFEINPASAGTPHEACCAIGLLTLAGALAEAGWPEADRYRRAAALTLDRLCASLWDPAERIFRDHPAMPGMVPNKAAAICEALCLLAELDDRPALIAQYVVPALDGLLAYQARQPGPLAGAIAQNKLGGQVIEKYFPIYIARCVPALLAAHRLAGHDRHREAALAALGFVARWMRPDGSLPTAVYPGGRANDAPSWIAPLGDVLRAADALRPHGFAADLAPMLGRLLAGQDCSGGIQLARGFAAQGRLMQRRARRIVDLRDLLHVVGWCDKAFSYLAGLVTQAPPAFQVRPFEQRCELAGTALVLRETATCVEALAGGAPVYRWRKGQPWPEIAAAAFWLR